MKFSVGVYWGRFNPPHKGHMKVVKMLPAKADKLVIAIGSAEFENTKKNPFNGAERCRMLKAYLKEEGIKGVKVIAVPDGKSYSSAMKNLVERVPKFDVIFLSSEKSSLAGFLKGRVKVAEFKRTGGISSTKLRNAIASDEKWEHLTGKSVARLIKKLKGTARIKSSYRVHDHG